MLDLTTGGKKVQLLSLSKRAESRFQRSPGVLLHIICTKMAMSDNRIWLAKKHAAKYTTLAFAHSYTYVYIEYQRWLSERFKLFLSNPLRGPLTTDNTKISPYLQNMEHIPVNQVLKEMWLVKIIVSCVCMCMFDFLYPQWKLWSLRPNDHFRALPRLNMTSTFLCHTPPKVLEFVHCDLWTYKWHLVDCVEWVQANRQKSWTPEAVQVTPWRSVFRLHLKFMQCMLKRLLHPTRWISVLNSLTRICTICTKFGDGDGEK